MSEHAMDGNPIRLSRRSFLEGAGLLTAGLALELLPTNARAAMPAVYPPLPAQGFRPTVFVHVAPDGVMTIVCHRSEMGQGVRSSLPVLIADELGADLARVKVTQGDGDSAYGDQNTDGSSSVRMFFTDLRYVGATARTMLITVAARRWGVPANTCVARDHAVFHPASKRSLGFGALANDAAKLPVPERKDVTLRPRSELRHLGKELPLLDGPDIVTGKAVFGADVVLPGMLTAMIVRPPVAGGRAARHDATRTLAVPGVKHVVELPAPKLPFVFQPLGGIAVVAENTWAAMRGRSVLDVTWEHGDNAGYDSAGYRQELTKVIGSAGKVVRNVGDADAALASAKRRIEADYHTPHLSHAPMEPPVAVARVEGGRCEVWASTQDPQTARTEVARALGIDESQVTLHVTLLGGGFGRKSKPDYVVEAALVSRAVGAPVRVQWTREDDVRHDYYHSTSAQRLTAALDDSGKIVAWHHRIAFPSIGSTFSGATFAGVNELNQGILDLPLSIPHVRAENCEARAHTRIGWLRSVANIYHAFSVQSFIDELAHARGTDPRDTLLEVIGPPRIVTPMELGVENVRNYGQSLEEHPIDTGRLRRVIERVTELSRWDTRKQEGRALGLAAHRSFLSYVAVVMSVVKDPDGRIRVDEAWIVADAGTVINMERVRAQFEGAVVFGMSLGLYGAITMKDGATEQSNFRDYRLVRIAEAPRRIHVDVIPSEGPPCGVGEPGVPPVAPALANAIFALTGTRVRELPFVRSVRV
ncbi:xanthine dehydrogenase family protein molybdopterin-binding subunit [Vitiosangium sp. GDMCC 1.1324]|uniref:xanthine dehydrogenase family protein molybdopterin-binding subunit n=1 Tax=Vitiosangium sp. (strain GDMCC 1.1324) TaxID=2138576 RepID=UPI000D35773E|nr:molybdopterin cofactor-binding domain-containing protein [Vitiosangium sp. GDMCC 1.1324]PTL85917.1 twin-arginine translocation pathway signal protein [Vitiosangium sp. GDMCC 1.1324]